VSLRQFIEKTFGRSHHVGTYQDIDKALSSRLILLFPQILIDVITVFLAGLPFLAQKQLITKLYAVRSISQPVA
jgi:hypothetical protein